MYFVTLAKQEEMQSDVYNSFFNIYSIVFTNYVNYVCNKRC